PLVLELKALAIERKLERDGVGLGDAQGGHRRKQRQVDLADVDLWRNRDGEAPRSGAGRRFTVVRPANGRQRMMDAETDLGVVEFALCVSFHLVCQNAIVCRGDGALPLKRDRPLGVPTPAMNTEPVLVLIDRDLEELRRNGSPVDVPNRNVDATCDL